MDKFIQEMREAFGEVRVTSLAIRIIDGERLSNAMSQLAMCPVDGTKEVVIKDWKADRRVIQNALYWVWLNGLVNQTGYTKEELHERFKRTYMLRIYQAEQVNENQLAWIALYTTISQLGTKEMKEQALKTLSTTWADVSQFREYLNDIESFCQSKGFVLPVDPKYKEAMGMAA